MLPHSKNTNLFIIEYLIDIMKITVLFLFNT